MPISPQLKKMVIEIYLKSTDVVILCMCTNVVGVSVFGVCVHVHVGLVEFVYFSGG